MSNALFLKETPFFDFSHPAIQRFVASLSGDTTLDKVHDAYTRIRDDINYNPYTFGEGESALKASYAATHDSAYCIPKSALMVASCRALGVPARIGLADVKNHLSSAKLNAWLKTDLFVMHGYAEIWLNEKWVKCTPVFNRSLCEKVGIEPLHFDGQTDSIFHPYTKNGAAHMEYVNQHGSFADMPVSLIFDTVKRTYPHIDLLNQPKTGGALELEIDQPI